MKNRIASNPRPRKPYAEKGDTDKISVSFFCSPTHGTPKPTQDAEPTSPTMAQIAYHHRVCNCFFCDWYSSRDNGRGGRVRDSCSRSTTAAER